VVLFSFSCVFFSIEFAFIVDPIQGLPVNVSFLQVSLLFRTLSLPSTFVLTFMGLLRYPSLCLNSPSAVVYLYRGYFPLTPFIVSPTFSNDCLPYLFSSVVVTLFHLPSCHMVSRK